MHEKGYTFKTLPEIHMAERRRLMQGHQDRQKIQQAEQERQQSEHGNHRGESWKQQKYEQLIDEHEQQRRRGYD